jgi:hypothetical protein
MNILFQLQIGLNQNNRLTIQSILRTGSHRNRELIISARHGSMNHYRWGIFLNPDYL